MKDVFYRIIERLIEDSITKIFEEKANGMRAMGKIIKSWLG